MHVHGAYLYMKYCIYRYIFLKTEIMIRAYFLNVMNKGSQALYFSHKITLGLNIDANINKNQREKYIYYI